MFSFLKRVIRKLYREIKRLYYVLSIITHKNVYVFGMPFHSNAGDQAQSLCIENWVNTNYPNRIIRWFDASHMHYTNYSILSTLKRCLKKSDIIFLHSGYHTTDLYMWEEQLQREVIKTFPNHRIIILPQTVNYTTEKEKNESVRIYNSHKDLLLFCRDNVSFDTAKELFPSCKLFLYPDIVTTMIGRYRYSNNRSGILLCMRNDKESFFSESDRNMLIEKLSAIDKVEITDTTLDINADYFISNRKAVLEELWNTYSKYKVVVTDRYHGTIFSLIAATPVIVMPSTDHKLKSGVDWFPDEFKDYIQYVPEKQNIIPAVKKMLDKELDHMLPTYFEDNYYSKLKMLIEGD